MPSGLLQTAFASAFGDNFGPGLLVPCPSSSSSSRAAAAAAATATADPSLHVGASTPCSDPSFFANQSHFNFPPRGVRPNASRLARTAFAEKMLSEPGATEPPAMQDLWQNTAGLPDVSEMTASPEFYSPDIADSLGGGQFKPTFGCKCGDWVPAHSHPEIEFKPGFLEGHPDFEKRLRTIHVHMDDITANKVHWDATYDLRKYRQAGRRLRLNETTPHEPEGGTQLRFMTFCPPKGGASHQYVLKVSAYDDKGEPIDYLQDKSAMYVAKPPKEHKPKAQGAADHGKEGHHGHHGKHGKHDDKDAAAAPDGKDAAAKPEAEKDSPKDGAKPPPPSQM